jgi:hypothetical protein
MSLIILLAALTSAAWVARRLRSENALLLSPAITSIGWSLSMGVLVGLNVTVEAIWLPFWFCTWLSFLASALAMRRKFEDLRLLVVPALCTLAILSPYVLHGIATFPGSWFWDGFAYLAAGETFWSHPRNETPQELELLYVFGRSLANLRFTASVLLAVFRGVIPLGGDSQASMGYLLILCVFSFSCSCYYLARVALPKHLQIIFVVLATVSGPILNLVWANNFDHLLALSIAPALTAFAIDFQWTRRRDAVFAGLSSASLVYIYPEMAAFLLMPAALVLAFRAIKERPPLTPPALIATATFILMMSPMAGSIYRFMVNQISTRGHEMTLRPGNGYFPTLLDIRCFYGSIPGWYAPFQPCASTPLDIFKAHVGIALVAAILVGMFKRRDGLSVSAGLLSCAALFFIIKDQYDYAGFKILASGTHIFTLLAVAAFVGVSRPAFAAGIASGLVVLIVVAGRIVNFDRMVKVKTMAPFAELTSAVPQEQRSPSKSRTPFDFNGLLIISASTGRSSPAVIWPI